MANNTGMKLLVVAAVVVASYLGVTSYLRPTAVVQTAGPGKVARAAPAQIKVRAEKSLDLKTEIGGRVLNDLEEGKAVKAGEVVVEIDTEKIALDVKAIENELTAAKAKYEVSKQLNKIDLAFRNSDLLRKKREFDAGQLAEVTYQLLEKDAQVLALNQQSLEADAEKNIADIELRQQSRKLDVAYGRLKAPFDGTLTNLQVPQSALVSAGQTIATLITNTRVIEARISEENSVGVAAGQTVRAWFAGIQGDFHGTVTKLLPNQDAQTLRYIAYLDLDVPAAKLEKTGLSGEGVILIDEKQARVALPQRALYRGQAYVVKDGRVEIRTVKLGYVSESVAEVVSGVEPGEEVITDNQDQFRAGQRVRTTMAAASPAAK